MKIDRSTGNRIQKIIVRKPYVLILSFLFILFLLFEVSWRSTLNVYIPAQGIVVYDGNDPGGIYFITDVSTKYENRIEKNRHAIWYSQSDGKRYYGTISSIERQKYQDRLTVRVIPSRRDIQDELGVGYRDYRGTVQVELFFKKKKVLEKLVGSM
jgi:hypothetical protein